MLKAIRSFNQHCTRQLSLQRIVTVGLPNEQHPYQYSDLDISGGTSIPGEIFGGPNISQSEQGSMTPKRLTRAVSRHESGHAA